MRGARIWKQAAAAGILAAMITVLASAPASAAQTTLAAGPYAAVTGWATPQVLVLQGDALNFVNTDVSAHRVEAKEFGPTGPLFASTLAGIGQSVPVDRVSSLPPGTYAFVCTLHTSMTGTITVLAG
jgi:plastocyanin